MNVERLQAVRDAILKDADHYNQQILFRTKVNDCRTEACIAGRCILMFDENGKEKELQWLGYYSPSNSVYSAIPFLPFEIAGSILELSDEEQERLFNEIDLNDARDAAEEYNEDYLGWPLKFAKMYEDATSGIERAKAAAARIDFFIATNGTDVVVK